MTNLLGISKNNSKDAEEIQVIVFGIEIEIKSFIAKLSNKKCEKTVKTTSKILGKQSVIFLDI